MQVTPLLLVSHLYIATCQVLHCLHSQASNTLGLTSEVL